MKSSFLVSLSIFLSLQAFAEKKTPEQYWTETNFSTNVLLTELRLLQSESCYAELKAYRGCVAAVNAIAAKAEPALQLVPTNVARDVGPVTKSFGPLSLVRVLEENPAAQESLRVIWEKSEAKRKRKNEALASAFQATRASRTDFETIFRELIPVALKDRNQDALVAGSAASAFLAEAVDAHARIEPMAQLQDSMNDANENFTGIGATLQSLSGKTVVASVIEGGPAEKSGVKANDVILAVDSSATEGKKVDDVVKLIRGPEGSTVTLRVLRKGQSANIRIVRAKIKLENVEAKIINDLGAVVGFIKLRSFMDKKACTIIAQKIQEFESQRVTGIVLDLRGNGGGLLDQGVCIGGLFLGQKVVVKVKDLESDRFEDLPASRPAITKLPVVALIDGGSASASEILAGALQDYQRSWVIGERSFGKGTVQAPSGFYNQNIVLYRTIQRFYQPSGRTNQMVGISPDIEVPAKLNATADERFTLREGDIYPNGLEAVGPVWRQARPADVQRIEGCLSRGGLAKAKVAAAERSETPADYQLLTAQEVLGCK